jgi:hypothetical protein
MTSNNQLLSIINLSRSLFSDGGLIDSGSISLANASQQLEDAIASLGLDEDSFTSLVAERGL